MIKLTDIKPDFKLVKKYIKGYINRPDIEGAIIEVIHNDFEKNIPDFNNSSFENLLNKFNLKDNLSDLYIFAGHYRNYWLFYLEEGEEYFRGNKSMKCHNDNIIALKEFLKHDQCNKISLYSINNTVSITANVYIEEFIEFLNEYCKKVNPDQNLVVPKKQSYIKLFKDNLSEIYHYLRNETIYRETKYQDTDVYNFIESLCLTMNIDIENLSSELRKYVK